MNFACLYYVCCLENPHDRYRFFCSMVRSIGMDRETAVKEYDAFKNSGIDFTGKELLWKDVSDQQPEKCADVLARYQDKRKNKIFDPCKICRYSDQYRCARIDDEEKAIKYLLSHPNDKASWEKIKTPQNVFASYSFVMIREEKRKCPCFINLNKRIFSAAQTLSGKQMLPIMDTEFGTILLAACDKVSRFIAKDTQVSVNTVTDQLYQYLDKQYSMVPLVKQQDYEGIVENLKAKYSAPAPKSFADYDEQRMGRAFLPASLKEKNVPPSIGAVHESVRDAVGKKSGAVPSERDQDKAAGANIAALDLEGLHDLAAKIPDQDEVHEDKKDVPVQKEAEPKEERAPERQTGEQKDQEEKNHDSAPDEACKQQRDDGKNGPEDESKVLQTTHEDPAKRIFENGFIDVSEAYKNGLVLYLPPYEIYDIIRYLSVEEWVAIEPGRIRDVEGLVIYRGSGICCYFISSELLTEDVLSCLFLKSWVNVITMNAGAVMSELSKKEIHAYPQLYSLTAAYNALAETKRIYPVQQLLASIGDKKMNFRSSEMIDLLQNYGLVKEKLVSLVEKKRFNRKYRNNMVYEFALGTAMDIRPYINTKNQINLQRTGYFGNVFSFDQVKGRIKKGTVMTFAFEFSGQREMPKGKSEIPFYVTVLSAVFGNQELSGYKSVLLCANERCITFWSCVINEDAVSDYEQMVSNEIIRCAQRQALGTPMITVTRWRNQDAKSEKLTDL